MHNYWNDCDIITITKKKGILVMLENVSNQTCASCNSHIFGYESNGVIIFECSYCGLPVEEPEIKIAKMVDYKYE